VKKPIQAILLLALACGRKEAETYRTEPATVGPVSEIVNATGDVQAIVTVNVGSQVSGTISRLLVDFNSKVKKDQLLATIDPRLFAAQLEKADAGLASAQANVEKARVQLADAERLVKRLSDLVGQQLVSQSDVDTAVANRDGFAAQLAANKAAVLQARADRTLAAANLSYTRITSPIDGIVVSRSIDVGQTVAAAFQAPTLFTIANDLTKMQILANVDEADVGKVKEGQPTSFTVDAYPAETFIGTIREVRQAPNTIQNVVTYAAVIDAPNPERKLRQGMTAAVTVTASKRDSAVRVPNAALRWKPATDAVPDPGPRAKPGAAQAAERPAGRPRSADPSAGDRPGGARPPGRSGRVFKLENGMPVAVPLRLGISDGQRTEVLEGLADGVQVIVGDSSSGGKPSGPRRGPF
jgi:HlyD family secretion protein